MPGVVTESGDYRVTITDANGCQTITPAVAVRYAQPLQLAYAVDQIPCFGGENGSIDLTVGAGTAPYTYAWTNAPGDTVSTQQDPTAQLTEGTYLVTVTDAAGCTAASIPLVIDPAPEQLMLTAGIEQEPVDCFGGSNGSLSAAPSGGTPPYQYFWTEILQNNDNVPIGGNTPVLPFLSAGTYRLRVVDDNDCLLVSAPVELEQPESVLAIDSAAVVPTRCADSADGRIEVFVSGGWGGYTYEWFAFPGVTDSLLTELPAGSYQVEINDAEGCRRISPFYTITSPDNLTAQLNLTAPTSGNADGAIAVLPTGGTAPYEYTWADDASTDSLRTGLVAGEYTLTLTDAQGCDTVLVVLLESANATRGNLPLTSFTVSPNPTNELATLSWTAPQTISGRIQLYNAQGIILDTQPVNRAATGTYSIDLSAYPAGLYRVVLSTQTGEWTSAQLLRQ